MSIIAIGNELRSELDAAEKEMAKLKDEFLSAEHYLLALTNCERRRGASCSRSSA